MRSLRAKLIAAFVVATLLPLGATIWITTSLLERSLGYATTAGTGPHLADARRHGAAVLPARAGGARAKAFAQGARAAASYAGTDRAGWPEDVRAFWDSGEAERFALSGPGGDHLDFMRRGAGGVDVYRRDLGGIRMQAAVGRSAPQPSSWSASIEARDLRRGFTLTLLLLVAVVWLVSLAPLLFMAHRISQPIRQLTAGLTGFAAGDWDRRLATGRDDEVGRAVTAFNDMAEQLRRSRERLVYLTQMSSWQTLARKTAHELKNSLTPIRLTVEEMLARQPQADRAFMEQAAQIVVSEIETLERRVRAFSEFASEPPVDAGVVRPQRRRDRARGAAEAGASGHRLPSSVRCRGRHASTRAGSGQGHPDEPARKRRRGGRARRLGADDSPAAQGSHVVVEVHDSGPGLSDEARRTLFEPTITFKKHGMGLGLSIARKNALLLGGDITLVTGSWAAPGFRVTLAAAPATESSGLVTRKRHIVVVDDEPNIGLSLRLILEGEGYRVTICESAGRVPRRSGVRAGPTCICWTCACPTATASTCCGRSSASDDPTPVVMISGHGTIRDAVEATRSGAFDFLEKPLARDRVLLVVKNALERSRAAAREPAVPGAGGRRAAHDRPQAPRSGGPWPRPRRWRVRRRRAADRRIGNRQGAAGGAHPPREPVRVACRSSR